MLCRDRRLEIHQGPARDLGNMDGLLLGQSQGTESVVFGRVGFRALHYLLKDE